MGDAGAAWLEAEASWTAVARRVRETVDRVRAAR
jgi:hypothetical protein